MATKAKAKRQTIEVVLTYEVEGDADYAVRLMRLHGRDLEQSPFLSELRSGSVGGFCEARLVTLRARRTSS